MRPGEAQQVSLDDAIDRVAARLTHVDDVPVLAARIANALPERSSGWAIGWVVAGLASLALIAVLRQFDEGSTVVLRTGNASVALTPSVAAALPTPAGTTVEPQIARRTFLEPSLNPRRTDDYVDHEFALPALAPAEALSMTSLNTDELPAEDALTIDPLGVAELPLSADFPQR